MKVFIGYSGETSAKIASILQNWLSRMFDGHITVDSSSVTGPGYSIPLAEAMKETDRGLLCVTSDNVHAQWGILLTAAAFRNMWQRRPLLISLLFDVDVSRLGASLSALQSYAFNANSMRELLRMLNSGLGADALPADELERRLKARYPTLEGLIQYTLAESVPQTPDDGKRNELDALSLQIAELTAQIAILTKRVEGLETELSAANPPRRDSRMMTGEAGYAQ